MSTKTSLANNRLVKPGIYEIQSGVASLFLNSMDGPVYNGWCDDALTLKPQPSRRGKWEIIKVGDGYTIKQACSGMYCALADGGQFLYQPVILSSIPTVWSIEYVDQTSEKVRILWSVSDIAWECMRSSNLKEPLKLVMGNLDSNNSEEKLDSKEMFVWNLCSLGEQNVPCDRVIPGLYSLQNKVSGTYVMPGLNGTIGCWPKDDFKDQNTKLWEVAAFGQGYTIRLTGTDQYVTLKVRTDDDKLRGRMPIFLSSFPASWRIVPNTNYGTLKDNEGYFQLFWGDTTKTWDLNDGGKGSGNNSISIQTNENYEPCRLFKLIP